MSSAVHSLQKAILAGNQSLTQLLRQTKVIAAKLGLEDVEAWVDLELNGYSDGTEPPQYREFATQAIQIRNPIRGWEFAGHFHRKMKARQPIADIEHLSNGGTLTLAITRNLPVDDGIGSSIASDWPQRALIAGASFRHIVDAVTNALLQWTTELDKRGIKGDDMDFSDKEKQSASNQVFNIQKFTGIVGNVTNSEVTLYDYSSVNQLLIDHGIPKQDRRELEDIVDELKEAPPEKKQSLLKRGEDWIVKHKALLGAAGEAVGKAIGAAVKH
jgi:AbiTii